ncbi:MAG: cytochrome c [Proteobacteria bacterium]|nr:cytochrome c [Pseudomonadota bacterium]
MKTKPILLAAVLSLLVPSAMAQVGRNQFPQQGGEALYKGICQDCHMPDGRGAEGAGHYPALAKNTKLAEPGYPISVVTHGLKSMPAFGGALSDQQIADVANYVRTHFGNAYKDTVKPEDVQNAR